MLLRALVLSVLIATVATASDAAAPSTAPLTVVFTVSDMANVMDIAGSWEVFQDVADDKGQPRFRLVVVSNTKTPLHLTGGMTIVPDYTFADAPRADIVVIGAQMRSPALIDYLKAQHTKGATLMSVCAGAFKLADTGLLDGKRATTHHDFLESFQRKLPKVTLVPGNRYVQSDTNIFTAGGLTSGVDLALHLVELRFGHATAASTANYLEYSGQGWKHPEGGSPVTD